MRIMYMLRVLFRVSGSEYKNKWAMFISPIFVIVSKQYKMDTTKQTKWCPWRDLNTEPSCLQNVSKEWTLTATYNETTYIMDDIFVPWCRIVRYEKLGKQPKTECNMLQDEWLLNSKHCHFASLLLNINDNLTSKYKSDRHSHIFQQWYIFLFLECIN